MGRFDHLAARLEFSSETAPPPAAAPAHRPVSLTNHAVDLTKHDTQHSAAPVALGEPITPEPPQRLDWGATTPVAAPAAPGSAEPSARCTSGYPVYALMPGGTDPLAILTTQGLELAGDDKAFVRQHLMGMTPDSKRTTLDQYARIWLAAMEGKPEHQQQNAGRFAANTWLRTSAP